MVNILVDMLFRHLITIFMILLFGIKLWTGNKASDELMYKAKAQYYVESGTDRRARK